MAFHCGDLDRLKGLHGTPIDGTTLLHISIDFVEKEIFDWFLELEADVNAVANIDNERVLADIPLYSCNRKQCLCNGR